MAETAEIPKVFSKSSLRSFTTIQNWLIKRNRGLEISTWNPASLAMMVADSKASHGTGSRGSSGCYVGETLSISDIYRNGTIHYIIGKSSDGIEHRWKAMWKDHYANVKHPHHTSLVEVENLIKREQDQRRVNYYTDN